jgi:hypothetical protein
MEEKINEKLNELRVVLDQYTALCDSTQPRWSITQSYHIQKMILEREIKLLKSLSTDK